MTNAIDISSENPKELNLLDLLVDSLPSEIIQHAAEMIINEDVNSFNEWHRLNDGNISEKVLNSVSGVASKYFRTQNQFHFASFWANQHSEEKDQEEMRGVIWNEEKEFLLSDYQAEPERVFERLMTSKEHQAHWMGFFFRMWFQDAPDPAKAWFENNHRRMWPVQKDHILIIFAEKNRDQGYKEVSLGWLKQLSRQSILDDLSLRDSFEGILN